MSNTITIPNAAQVTEMVMDQWLNSFNMIVKSQEQAENATRMWLDQARTAREQCQKVITQIAEQAKENQRLLQEMVTSTVRLSLETYRIATNHGISDVSQRVEELNKQVDTLTRKAQSKVAAAH